MSTTHPSPHQLFGGRDYDRPIFIEARTTNAWKHAHRASFKRILANVENAAPTYPTRNLDGDLGPPHAAKIPPLLAAAAEAVLVVLEFRYIPGSELAVA